MSDDQVHEPLVLDGGYFDVERVRVQNNGEDYPRLIIRNDGTLVQGDGTSPPTTVIVTDQQLAITSTSVVNSQAAMLALVAQEGDVAIRTDLNKTFILAASPATTLANWKELLSPTDAVSSVNGEQGIVTLDAADVGAVPAAGGTMSGDLNLADNELVRANLQDYSEALGTVASASGTVAINCETGNVWDLTLTGNVTTLTLSNPPASGRAGSLTLIIRQDATARTITWPASVSWSGGTAPDISAVSKVFVVTLITTNAGTRWYGSLGMTGMTA